MSNDTRYVVLTANDLTKVDKDQYLATASFSSLDKAEDGAKAYAGRMHQPVYLCKVVPIALYKATVSYTVTDP